MTHHLKAKQALATKVAIPRRIPSGIQVHIKNFSGSFVCHLNQGTIFKSFARNLKNTGISSTLEVTKSTEPSLKNM